MKMTGNTVLVTGGGSGIGRALAEEFAKRGNQVIIAGRRQAVLDEVVAANPAIRSMTLDIADAADVKRFAEEMRRDFPALNVVIQNAGVMKNEDLLEDGPAVAEETIAINLLGPIRLTAALMPQLKAQESAALVTVTSGIAFVPFAVTPAYGATKAGLHSWTQSLRFQAEGTGLEVIELAPPYTQTTLQGEHQAKDPNALSLDAYIEETMRLLEQEAERENNGEILVERVKPLRYAERNGNQAELLRARSGPRLQAVREARQKQG